MYKCTKILCACVLAATFLLPGCIQARRGSQVAVEQSSNRPEWLDKRPQSDDPLFFVGEVTNAKERALATEEAEYDAIKRIAGNIGQEINGEFSAMVKGSNRADLGARLGTTVESVVNARVSEVRVSGVQTVERWWARYETEGADGMVRDSYNVAVLVKIPRRAFEQAKLQLLDSVKGSDQVKANADAAQALEDFKAHLQTK